MSSEDTLWKLQAHTTGKHRVLESYLNAWLPIMSSWSNRLLFVDAFAGPGEYLEGEPGSPIIALQTFIEHSARPRMNCEFRFFFIEADKARFNHLNEVLGRFEDKLPSNCSYFTENSTFDQSITRGLDRLETQGRSLEPTLVMIDPFGIKGVSMDVIRRILSNPKPEVYISFMYRDINRFREADHFKSGMDALFGDTEWHDIAAIQDEELRKTEFFELFGSKLKHAGAKYVVNFELYGGDRLVYSIFFGTKNLEGCDQMKKAIWKSAPFGDYKFRGDFVGQNMFGEELVDIRGLRRDLYDYFGAKGWVSIEEVTDFVKSDMTRYHTSHLKTKTLQPMEDDKAIEIKPDSRGQPRTYPDGTVLRFLKD